MLERFSYYCCEVTELFVTVKKQNKTKQDLKGLIHSLGILVSLTYLMVDLS